jgi:hypothetical protein
LLASNAQNQASTFLRGIKNHFEKNQVLRAIFGDFVTGADKWSETEIIVNRRKSFAREPTIMCTGMDTILPSRHFDLVIADDLITEDNAGTPGQRNKAYTYFYKTLIPCVQMPDGRLYLIGTRWHEEDLYSHLVMNDYKDAHIVLGVLDHTDRSRWEEKFPTARMHRLREANLGVFELQWMCVSGKVLGGIWTPEHFTRYDTLPAGLRVWQAFDPAVSGKKKSAACAHCTIGVDPNTKEPYLIDYRLFKAPAPAQLRFIAQRWDEHPNVMRVVIEANGYQLAVKQNLQDQYPRVKSIARYTTKDKPARANWMSMRLGLGGIHVRRGHYKFIRTMCSFPHGKYSEDLFDCVEMAYSQAIKGARRARRNEPGVI